MRAITLTQPWATLIALGKKKIETRDWQTHYRGPLAIHAAKGMSPKAREVALEVFEKYLSQVFASLDDLPRGMVVATCTIEEIIEMEKVRPASVGGREIIVNGVPVLRVPPLETAFGDYRPGRYAWLLSDVVKLPEPIPARGALGLWSWDRPDARQLRRPRKGREGLS